MNSSQSVSLNHQFDVVGHSIADVRRSILVRLIIHLKKAEDLLLVDADATGNLRQTLVGFVALFVDYIHIEEVGLLVEERFAEVPELVRLGLQDSGACLVDEGARWMLIIISLTFGN